MDEGYEIFAMLAFDLDDEELSDIVEDLGEQEPHILYPEAWRVLSDEWTRRQAARDGARVPLDLSAAVFEDLPLDLQARLRSARVPVGHARSA